MKVTIALRKWRDIIWHNYNAWYGNATEYYSRRELQEWLYVNLSYDGYDGYVIKENGHG